MARYIDADALIRLIEIEFLCNHNYSKRDAIGCVKAIPTADVVPKSEYDNLKMQFDALDCECDRLEKAESEKHDKIIEAKAEVAREIFEEIEKAHDECIWIDITTRIGYLQQTKFEHKLAELKKKYTEGEK